MAVIKNTDLLINTDGSIYHLSLRPDQVADTIIVVGDPDRVQDVSFYFDRVDTIVRNREFISHTGRLKRRRITVLSTGIGTDNIDIVINELDALVNIDLNTREIKPAHKALDIIRIGTSGAIQPDIPVGSFAIATYGMGLDNLLYYYLLPENTTDREREKAFIESTGWNDHFLHPYFIKGSEELIQKFEGGMVKGITATAPGFYGPQGRILRIGLADPDMMARIQSFSYMGDRIINFEMETAALYALGNLLGHHVVTVCAMVANRATNEYCVNHKPVIKKLIELVLESILK